MNKLCRILIIILLFSCKGKTRINEVKSPDNLENPVHYDLTKKQIDSLRSIYGDSIEIVDLTVTTIEEDEPPPPPPPPKLPEKSKKKK